MYIYVGNFEGTRPFVNLRHGWANFVIWKWFFKKCGVREKAHVW